MDKVIGKPRVNLPLLLSIIIRLALIIRLTGSQQPRDQPVWRRETVAEEARPIFVKFRLSKTRGVACQPPDRTSHEFGQPRADLLRGDETPAVECGEVTG